MRLQIVYGQGFAETVAEPAKLEAKLAASRRELEVLQREADEEASELKVTRVGRQWQRLGRYLRLIGRFEEAEAAVQEAMAIWASYERKRARFVCGLQLVEIDLGRGRLKEALERIEELEASMDEALEVYADQVWEARGRCLAASREPEAARRALSRALKVRRQRGNQRHIEVTQDLMERI